MVKKLAKIYKRNRWDRWSVPFYRRSIFWLMLSSMMAILLSLLMALLKNFATKVDGNTSLDGKVDGNNATNIVSIIDSSLSALLVATLIALLLLFIRQIYKIVKYVKLHKGYYISSYRLERRIKKSLIQTMVVNTMKHTKRIEVPSVKVDLSSIKDTAQATAWIERLPSMNDIDVLSKIVSNAFRHKYKDYAVIDFKESDDALSFAFVLEDVNINKTLVYKTVDDMMNKDLYTIELHKDHLLTWQADKQPHAIISGATGTGKTTLLYNIILQLFVNGVDSKIDSITDGGLYLIDPKNEYRALTSFFKNVYNEPVEVLDLLSSLVAILDEREKVISDEIAKTGQLGATAKDFGFNPIYIIFDEVNALVSLYDTKELKEFYRLLTITIQKGRSSGLYWIFSGQNFNADTLKVSIRNAPSLRIGLGDLSQEDKKFIFNNNDETIKDGAVDKYTGYYTLRGVTEQPQRFFGPNLHKYKLNDVSTFKTAYMKGLEYDKKRRQEKN